MSAKEINCQNISNNNNSETGFDLSFHKYNLYQQFFIVGIDPKILLNINKSEIKMILNLIFTQK